MEDRADVIAGQAVYNRATLPFTTSECWACHVGCCGAVPRPRCSTLYDRNIGVSHLELGVGTGYFLDMCHFPDARPRITLVDLNPTPLAVSARRISRFGPEVIVANVLDPLPVPAGSYDSVAANFLLHCLPGDWRDKGKVFANAATALRPGGCLFGSTILAHGVSTTAPARSVMRLYNARGIFHNARDDLAGLDQELADHFADHRVTVRGTVALFEARTAQP